MVKFINKNFQIKSLAPIKSEKGSGFSLIEAIIYIALVSSITVVFTSFTVDVISSSVKSLAIKEVNQSARLVVSRISQEIKAARQITSVATNQLTLINYDGDTIEFNYDSLNNLVNIDTGSGDVQMSNSSIRVTDLTFEEVQDETIKIHIVVDQKNPTPSDREKSHIEINSVVVVRSSLY